MQNTFLIIDDDINIRKMLAHIILKNDLGRVVAELDSGLDAEREILFYNPDVVLIDLLLPVKDGIEIIQKAKDEGYKGKFIMISQVEDERMISKAYENGIVFFIGKPINLVEAVNVIKGVCHSIELEKSVELIKSAVVGLGGSAVVIKDKPSVNDEINRIFADIGIISESGVKDLTSLIKKVIEFKKQYGNQQYQL
ncbi:response regulator [Lutispora thermophila]|uniref:Stage 0 sporulation protein A homolog n=1 Tax=Lutispora thermophila DSM 19022 TaxID=1122184 RepID=A0A1M6AT10_9FIRM|nr:response regulator [Lutispora thermophila]SHI39561.1 Response regulator receiver domain-containing protein [Lutispora thermophila DSM 19022]